MICLDRKWVSFQEFQLASGFSKKIGNLHRIQSNPQSLFTSTNIHISLPSIIIIYMQFNYITLNKSFISIRLNINRWMQNMRKLLLTHYWNQNDYEKYSINFISITRFLDISRIFLFKSFMKLDIALGEWIVSSFMERLITNWFFSLNFPTPRNPSPMQ